MKANEPTPRSRVMHMGFVDQGIRDIAGQQVHGARRVVRCGRCHSSSSARTSSTVTRRGERITGRRANHRQARVLVKPMRRKRPSAQRTRRWCQPAVDQLDGGLVHAATTVRRD